MKILIICHEFPPIGAGAGNAAFYLTKYLVSMNQAVTVLTSKFKKVNKLNLGNKIVYLSVLRRYIDRTSPLELMSFTLSGILYALLFIKRKKYDFCLAIHGIPSGWVALFIYKIFKIPYLVSLRGGDVPDFLPQSYSGWHRKIQFLTDLYWNNATLLIANSYGLKDIAENTAKRINKKITVVPNGVDCQMFKPEYTLRNNKTIKIIYTGRITVQKNLESLIKAVREVYLKMGNIFNLEVIGEGPLKKHLQNISSDLIHQGVLTFTDWLDKESLLLKYKQAHIFVLPSFYEGMSNSLLEAMSCGCMIIATDVAGNNELIQDKGNGFLFKPEDTLRLEDLLTNTLRSGWEVIEDMGNKSRQIVQQYDWNKVTDAYLEYINKFLEGTDN